jgi:hypothetical protein
VLRFSKPRRSAIFDGDGARIGDFRFISLLKKRQVEMTTLSSRGFFQVPGPEHARVSFAGIQSQHAFAALPHYFPIILFGGPPDRGERARTTSSGRQGAPIPVLEGLRS